MKAGAFAGGWLTVLLTMCLVAGYGQDADALVKKVKDKLATVDNYEANGVMKTSVPFIKVPESSITIYYKKPDKFKIKKQNGVTVVPRGGVNINLAALFAGDHYTAVAAGKTVIDNIAVTIIKLLPLDEQSEAVVSTLYIDEKESLIRKAVTTTRSNGTYEVEMSYGKYTQWALPDKVAFVFSTKDYKLPKGLAFDYDTGDQPKTTPAEKNQKGRVEISYNNYQINKGIPDNFFQ